MSRNVALYLGTVKEYLPAREALSNLQRNRCHMGFERNVSVESGYWPLRMGLCIFISKECQRIGVGEMV